MTITETTDASGNPEEPLEGTPAPTAREDADDMAQRQDEAEQKEAETFPRSYVEKLRQEAAGYRTRAQRADELAQRLHRSLVASTGRLADPSDLAFDEAHLEDETALETALDELLSRKPHLAARRVQGNIGQGVSSTTAGTVDLAALLRARAN